MNLPNVTICYRINDSTYQTNTIYRSLRRFLPENHLFIDTQTLPTINVLLAVIDENWEETTKTNLENNGSDKMLLEIEQALKGGAKIHTLLLNRPSVKIKLFDSKYSDIFTKVIPHLIDNNNLDDDIEKLSLELSLTQLNFQRQILSNDELRNEEKRLSKAFNLANSSKKQTFTSSKQENRLQSRIKELETNLALQKRKDEEIKKLKTEIEKTKAQLFQQTRQQTQQQSKGSKGSSKDGRKEERQVKELTQLKTVIQQLEKEQSSLKQELEILRKPSPTEKKTLKGNDTEEKNTPIESQTKKEQEINTQIWKLELQNKQLKAELAMLNQKSSYLSYYQIISIVSVLLAIAAFFLGKNM